MKKISKLGLISVLCLVLVIGGVFATWNYATNKIENPATDTMGLSLTLADTESERGTLSVTSKPTLTIDDTNNDYLAELVITGDLVITFTPKANSEVSIINNGINLAITFEVPEDLKYNNAAIITCVGFNLEAGEGTTKTTTVGDATLTYSVVKSNGNFVYTITKAELAKVFTLSSISLPTYTDYTNFDNVLSGKNITVKVADSN